MKEAQKQENDFWLDLGASGAWADMACRADWDGDASPDGRKRGFSGAENGTVYEPSHARSSGCSKGGAQPSEPAEQPLHGGQTPDVSTGNIPAEMPPVPPETWPGL